MKFRMDIGKLFWQQSVAAHGHPYPRLADLEYKREGMALISSLGTVAGSFENEPAHINVFHEAFPEAWHFQVETKHSGRPIEALAGTRRIADFRR